jgi:hypothetical protein
MLYRRYAPSDPWRLTQALSLLSGPRGQSKNNPLADSTLSVVVALLTFRSEPAIEHSSQTGYWDKMPKLLLPCRLAFSDQLVSDRRRGEFLEDNGAAYENRTRT